VKILFDHPVPFLLAHGGLQVQIEQTRAALQTLGVQCDFLRWWDNHQPVDLIHYFGRMPANLIQLARQKGVKVVLADLLTEQGARSPAQLKTQKWAIHVLQNTLPAKVLARYHWTAYREADACVALTSWEGHLLTELFGASPDRIYVVPNGVEEVFLQSVPQPRGPWLVCTATITERKRVLELAMAAVAARTPLWVIGKPYAESDSYARQFVDLARQHSQLLRYEGAVMDRSQLARIYREARGFVLLSARESLSLSALEAAACGCPLLLSDLPWARSVFKGHATYCPVTRSPTVTASALRRFYEAAPQLPPPPRPAPWSEIARQLLTVYEMVLNTSR
jgi:glycosyltransferase involved in cell wall biosynthesis